MPVIPKIAGGASLLSTIVDIHKTAMIYARQENGKAKGDIILATSVGNQKADYISFKDAQRKNWCNKKRLFHSIKEDFAAVKGYFKGIVEAGIRYLPKIALSAAAIIPKAKNSTFAYISTVALAAWEAWDFVRYGTGLFERKNYLKRK